MEKKQRVTVYQLTDLIDYKFMSFEFAKTHDFKKSDYKESCTILMASKSDLSILKDVVKLSNSGTDLRFMNVRTISPSDVIDIEGRRYYVDDEGFVRIPKSMWTTKQVKGDNLKSRINKIMGTPTKKTDVDLSELDLIKSILKGLTIKVKGNFKLDVSCTAIGLDLHAEYKDYNGSIEF